LCYFFPSFLPSSDRSIDTKNFPPSYEVKPGIATLDNFSDPTYFEAAYEEYLANATGPLATTGASSGLLSCAQIGCADLVPAGKNDSGKGLRPGLKEQYELQSKYFHSEAVTQE
jgi:choline dehydrogenase